MPLLARIGRRGKAALLVVLGFAIGGAALALADVPDSTGVIHACYQVAPGSTTKPLEQTGNVYVIDPSQGQACNSGDHPLDWNQTGPMGSPGPKGAPATGLTLDLRGVKNSAKPIGNVTLGSGKSKVAFEIEGFSFASAKGSGGGGGAGKVQVHDISITKFVDKSSPQLMLHCAKGQHIKEAVITMRKAGGDPKNFIKYKLTDVIVSSFQAESNGGKNTKPQENIAFKFAKIEFEH